MIDDIPQVESTVVIEVEGIEIRPKVVPAVWLRHGLHPIPEYLAERVTSGLYLISRPQMDLACRENVLQVPKFALTFHGGEHSLGVWGRTCVKADGQVIFLVMAGNALRVDTTSHLVDNRQAIRVELSKSCLGIWRLVVRVDFGPRSSIDRRMRWSPSVGMSHIEGWQPFVNQRKCFLSRLM